MQFQPQINKTIQNSIHVLVFYYIVHNYLTY